MLITNFSFTRVPTSASSLVQEPDDVAITLNTSSPYLLHNNAGHPGCFLSRLTSPHRSTASHRPQYSSQLAMQDDPSLIMLARSPHSSPPLPVSTAHPRRPPSPHGAALRSSTARVQERSTRARKALGSRATRRRGTLTLMGRRRVIRRSAREDGMRERQRVRVRTSSGVIGKRRTHSTIHCTRAIRNRTPCDIHTKATRPHTTGGGPGGRTPLLRCEQTIAGCGIRTRSHSG